MIDIQQPLYRGPYAEEKARRDVLLLFWKYSKGNTTKRIPASKVMSPMRLIGNNSVYITAVEQLEKSGLIEMYDDENSSYGDTGATITEAGVKEVQNGFSSITTEAFHKDTEKKVIELLEEIHDAEELANRGLLKVFERDQLRSAVSREVESLLIPDSDLFREYDSKRNLTIWSGISPSGYTTDIGNLSVLKNYLERILDEVGGKVDVEQRIFEVGEYYTARAALRGLLASASQSIWIFDEYLDDSEVLNIIEPYVEKGIDVRLIKGSPKASFRSDVIAMKRQYGHVELVDYVTQFHDRLVIVDSQGVYVFGGSLKDLGKKVSTMNKAVGKDGEKLVEHYENWWQQGKMLT